MDHPSDHLLQGAKQFSADSQLGISTPSASLAPVSCEGTGEPAGNRQAPTNEGGKKS
jgi:hypothetical protein